MSRAYNFCAGPAALPTAVLEQAQQEMLDFQGKGLSIMEMSHRDKVFVDIAEKAEQDLRDLMGISDDYAVLFLQGGASLQFYMTALNLLRPDEQADYLVTGGWSQRALKEAKRVGDAQAIWDDSENGFRRVPQVGEYTVRDDAVYLHYTSNNTLYGTQFHHLPDSGGKLLLLDACSDIAGVPCDISAHDLIYAGAQKNLGPPGVTLVILSPRALSRVGDDLPTMLDYNVHASKGSLFNTPNTFGIFALDRVFNWLEENGGLEASTARNQEKSGLLYAELDRTNFWRPHADKDSRSVMNVTWFIHDDALESVFLAEAEAAGLGGLKGHKSVGGIRASLYNGCPLESVEALVSFMRDFEAEHS